MAVRLSAVALTLRLPCSNYRLEGFMEKLLLSDVQVAQATGIARQNLRTWRCVGTGPRFVKVGTLVRYRRWDVRAWLTECASARRGARGGGAA